VTLRVTDWVSVTEIDFVDTPMARRGLPDRKTRRATTMTTPATTT